MKMTIVTQEGVLVNYDNVVSIAPALWDAEDIVTKESVPVFTLSAKTVLQEEEIQLGIFETEEELGKAWEELLKWLEKGSFPVFHIQSIADSEEYNGF